MIDGTVIDTHQHFWRYDAAEYGWIDDSMAALRRDFLPADAQREMAAAGVDGVDRRAGAADARGNALAARARGSPSVHRRRRRLGGSAGRRRGRRARAPVAASAARRRPPHRPGRAGRLSRAAGVSPRHRAPRAPRPDLRHPRLRAPAARGGRRSPARFRGSASSSITWASRTSGADGFRRVAARISTGWRRFPTYAASCRGW